MKDVNLLISNGVNIKKSLEIFGDMATYDDTLGVFLAEVSGKLEKLKAYKESSNMADYAIQVHSLKSDAKYFGFEKLAEMAYQHELESKENHMYYVHENFDSLMLESNRIVDLVKRYMSGESATSTAQIDINDTLPSEVKPNIDIPANSLLVTDDSDIIRNFISRIFQNQFQIITATDGKEAIEILKQNSENKIIGMLLDLYMPNVDGFQVLEFMRENNLFQTLPVSIITGNDISEVDKKVFEFPIVDILKKPFNEINIKNIVEKTINYNKYK